MTSRSKRNALGLLTKSGELAVAVPQVMSHRLTRMALSGPELSARDRKEFTGMVTEKQQAFAQSWIAMMIEMTRASQALALSLGTAFWLAPFGSPRSSSLHHGLRDIALGVSHKGIVPLHRRAKANAARLARTRLR